MAAGGYKEFVAGETLDEDEINDFLMQGMLVFAGTAARGSAITAPVEGQFSFLTDTDSVEFYDGSAWVQLSTSPGAAEISGTTGSPSTVTSGGYDYYTFTGDGSITVSAEGFADCLIIGGGSSGGVGSNTFGAGGGGAGAFVIQEDLFLAADTYTITVGAGGASSASGSTLPGNRGLQSSIGTVLEVMGGGPGAGFAGVTRTGRNGGSGGGDTRESGIGFAMITTQGNNGGNSSGVTPSSGGGGGGAGSVGGDASSSSTAGAGGAGIEQTVWAGATSTGVSNFYAGGGGGGGDSTGGAGGSGGGGAGSSGATTATSATANTGSGGGGSETGASGAGGSGLVIVRIAV